MQTNHTIPTRERILEIIKKEGSATVKSLTEAIGITPMAIRGHLNKLEKDHLISSSTLRQKLGRPLQVFALTDEGEDRFPKKYGRFAIELLEDVKQLDDGKTLDRVINQREQRIIQKRKEVIQAGQSPEEKMRLYCDFIRQLAYMPELLKISDNTFVLIVNNCPLKDVANEFKFCCDSELNILGSIFNEAKVSRQKNLIEKDIHCSYQFEF